MTSPASDTSPAPPRRLPPLTHYAKATTVVVGVLVLAYVLYQARSVALSVFLGFFLATGFEPFVGALERRGMRRGLAVLLLLLLAVVVIVGFVVLALRPAIEQGAQLVQQVPNLVNSLSDPNSTLGRYLQNDSIRTQIQSLAGRIPSLLTSSVSTVFGVLGTLVGTLFGLFTIAALTVYFALAMPRIQKFGYRVLREPQRVAVLQDALGKVGSYVTGQLTICACAGITAAVYLTLAGVPYSAVLGIAVALLDAIPQVGATVGAILCTLVALTVSLPLGAITFLFFIAYQQFENYVIAPRVFSRAVALSPVAVFIAVLAGGSLAGVVGALTALPVTAALKAVLRYVFRDQLASIGAAAPATPGATGVPIEALAVMQPVDSPPADGSTGTATGSSRPLQPEQPSQPVQRSQPSGDSQ